jgi:hypothetical protein
MRLLRRVILLAQGELVKMKEFAARTKPSLASQGQCAPTRCEPRICGEETVGYPCLKDPCRSASEKQPNRLRSSPKGA